MATDGVSPDVKLMLCAARENDVAAVRRLLEKDSSLANAKGIVGMAQFLLDHGADVNALDGIHNATPLAWADFQRKPDLIEFLQKHGGSLEE